MTAKRGYFISGKFDQFQRNIPYSALVDALTNLVKQLLGEPETVLQQWQKQLLQALGNNGQIAIEVIPDLELIIGKQPPVPELGPIESQNRFNLVFQQLIQALCQPDHPLVMFLDDMQWTDLATLSLLEQLLGDSQIHNLLLIIAYRDNELGSGHPLDLAIAQLQRKEVNLEQITLTPLPLDQIALLIAETLQCETQSVYGLAELVKHKTQGNPFFTNQFLKTLYSEGLLVFNHILACWQWDLARIEGIGFTDNVVELMIGQLQKLPKSVQGVLSTAAYLGTEFDLKTLSLIENQTPTVIFADLKLAMEAGFVVARSHLDENLLIQNYQFGHDQIQQAAYVLIPADEQVAKHLQIGRILLEKITHTDLDDNLFDIVDHLNQGLAQVSDPHEREDFARLNLRAGQKAIGASAYQVAITYLQQGIFLLSPNSWECQYGLSLLLHEEAVKAAFLSGELELMEHLSAIVMTKAHTALEQVKVSTILIEAYGNQGKLLKAIDIGLDILAQLGIIFPKTPQDADCAQSLEKIERLLADKQPGELINLAEMQDPIALAALHLLVKLRPVVFTSSLACLNLLITLKEIELSIFYGNAPLSAIAYSAYGLFLCSHGRNNIDRGYAFGELALTLISQSDSKEFETTVKMIVHSFISHWKIHLKETLEPLQSAHNVGLAVGNFAYAGYTAFDYCTHAYLIGKPLSEVQQEMQHYSAALKRMGQQSALFYLQGYHQAVVNLMDSSSQTYNFAGEIFDEQEVIELLKLQQNQAGLWHLYTVKLPLCYLFEEFVLAHQISELAKQCIGSGMAGVAVPILYFYDSLCCLALMSEKSIPESDLLWQQVEANQHLMEYWSVSAPMNYRHKFDLVAAERQRLLGEKLAAIALYESSIAGAKEHGYIQEAALANELAAKFYLSWGMEKIAQAYLQEAHYYYLCWGATAKVHHLETRYPQFFVSERSSCLPISRTSLNSSSNSSSAALDLSTVMKSSQAIASEIVLENLLQTLMKILLENAGAQMGCLLLPTSTTLGTSTKFSIAIYHHANGTNSYPTQAINLILPESLLHYVARTHKSVILDNPVNSGNFSRDPYIQSVQPLSILCYPLLNQGELVGIIYLEHQVTTGAFTSTQVELLQLLSGQAAIAITNAQLYAKVRNSEKILSNYNRTLEQQVAERTAALQRANQELARLAILDGLTKIANRRRFDDYLMREWERHLQEQQSLALILIDIDYFKRYNDHYGHQGGDECLIRVAQTLAQVPQYPHDLVARYGGEEFAAILPNTNINGALIVAESIRQAIAALAIPHAQSEVKEYVTLSLGVAAIIPTLDQQPEELIAQADQALYRAKHQGRDRAIAYRNII